jgi:hypothetical protein
MESFVFRPMTWPVFRIFSRNQLVRTSDRIEAAVVTLAALVVVVAAACAGAFGTIVYDASTHKYLEQAKARHPIVAIAIEDGKTTVTPETIASTVHVRWQANGIARTDVVDCHADVKAGEPLQVWVDAHGNRVDPPASPVCAGLDAVSFAIVAWLGAVLAVILAVSAARARINRTRDAQWEKEIRCVIDDGGGRTNTSQ